MIDLAIDISFDLLGLAALLTLVRILRGPTLADRILGLDTLTGIGIGMIALYAAHSRLTLYVDIAIALALVSFLSTAALARYMASKKAAE